MTTTTSAAAGRGIDDDDRPETGKTYEVNIEGRLYPWREATIAPAQIRELGGLPADQPVIEVNFKENTERTLAEGEHVELKPGHGFGKKIGFKRGDR